MSCETAGNAYNKIQVLAACDRTLAAIKAHRESEKIRMFSGKRKFGIGRVIDVEEAYQAAPRLEQYMVDMACGRQECIVTSIMTAARLCEGPYINLTPGQLSSISSYWDVV